MNFEFDLELDDRTLLRSFFKQLRIGFEMVIRRRRWADRFEIRFHGDEREYLVGALEEAEPEWDRVEKAIDDVSDSVLRRFGLSGQSLRVKLYYVGFWSDRVRSILDGAIWGDLWDAIKGVLENLNIILGSFSEALGAGDIIRELKDVILHNIDTEGS